MPFHLLAGSGITESHLQAWAKDRFGTQDVQQVWQGEIDRLEISRVGPETHGGSGTAAA